MGTYINASDIFDTRIYGLSNSVVASSTVNLYIADAEAVVNGYCAKQYTLPFASTPPIITKLSKDLTAYGVLDYLYSQKNQNVNDWVTGLRDTTMDYLKSIAEDEIRITYTGGTSATMDVNINMKTTRDYPTIFDVDTPYNWHASDNLLDAIDDARDAAD